jgi:PIN domain nuclease of toxin-antitoxin system
MNISNEVHLDAHVLLWWYFDHTKIKTSLPIIKDKENTVLVSDAVIWELVVKSSIGKLKLPANFFRVVEKDFDLLPITTKHIYRILHLDLIHRDPFDRMLIAQSVEENIPVISADTQISKYKIQVIQP